MVIKLSAEDVHPNRTVLFNLDDLTHMKTHGVCSYLNNLRNSLERKQFYDHLKSILREVVEKLESSPTKKLVKVGYHVSNHMLPLVNTFYTEDNETYNLICRFIDLSFPSNPYTIYLASSLIPSNYFGENKEIHGKIADHLSELLQENPEKFSNYDTESILKGFFELLYKKLI